MFGYLRAQQKRYLYNTKHSVSRALRAMCSSAANTVNTLLGETLSAERLLERIHTLLAKPLVINNKNRGLFGKENIIPIFLKLQL